MLNARYGLQSSPNTDLHIIQSQNERNRNKIIEKTKIKMPPINLSKQSPRRIPENRKIATHTKLGRGRKHMTSNTERLGNFKRVKDQLLSLEMKSDKLISQMSNSHNLCVESPTTIKENSLNLPYVLIRDQSVKSTQQDKRDQSLLNKFSAKDLSELILSNYGISEDVVSDVNLLQSGKWKINEKDSKRERYYIMLKRIIKDKARPEDINKDSSLDDFFSNSIISNFLNYLLSKTNDQFINDKLKEFRTLNLKKTHQKIQPTVFSRLQKDVKKRQTTTLSPNSSHNIN